MWTEDACRKGLTDKSAVTEHAWTNGHPICWDATKVLQRASRTMELVMKESLSIRTKPESERFNRDNGFDCWIATYKKLRGGASILTKHARHQLACGHLGPRRAYKLRGSATQLHSPWGLEHPVKRQQDKFLCYQVVYKRTVSIFSRSQEQLKVHLKY